jgi:hypothetical protein
VLVLWGAIAFVLLVGLFLRATPLIVVALLGAVGAAFTTYLYLRESPPGGPRSGSPASDADSHKGGTP